MGVGIIEDGSHQFCGLGSLEKKLLRWKEREQLQKRVWRERFRRVEKEEERVEAN